MLFSSWEFILIFLPVTWCLVIHAKGRCSSNIIKLILLAASLVFYGAWNISFVPLILCSILINYELGRQLQRHRHKRLLWFGIVLNLFPLFFYKYLGWFSGSDFISSLALPLGISFYTFQQIGYIVDCFRNRGIANNQSFLSYACFVTFFPQLIAGPIVNHKQLTPQFDKFSHASISQAGIYSGLVLFITGLCKKILIADNLAPFANYAFSSTDPLSIIEAWTGATAYALQLYFDFSGYCEMAMGIALLFGIRLPINFNSPYKSGSITEFWRRWHITLGAFFREYVYIPLGGNRHSLAITCCLVFIVAFISGIWHGAGFTFLLWGSLHGLGLITHKLFTATGYRLNKPLSVILTLLFVIVTWIPFRAPDLATAFSIWSSMFQFSGLIEAIDALVNSKTSIYTPTQSFLMLSLLAFVVLAPNIHEHKAAPSIKRALSYSSLVMVTLLSLGQSNEFLYFQF